MASPAESVKDAAPKVTIKRDVKKETAPPKSGGGLRSHLLAFTLGSSLAGGVGYYRLEQQISAAGAASAGAVDLLRADVVEAQEKLQARVAALEK